MSTSSVPATSSTTTPIPTLSSILLAPGSLCVSSFPGGKPFLLSITEWLSIQAYVNDALQLPADLASFKTALGAGVSDSIGSTFQPLITCYAGIKTHCTDWITNIYPAVISLASDIVEYGSVKAPTLYGAISKEADILISHPDDEKAREALKAILDNLSKEAMENSQRAVAVAGQIDCFASLTEKDGNTLAGTDGKGGLLKQYDSAFGTEKTEVAALRAQIAGLQADLAKVTENYNKDVIAASTSPTYAWIFPYGTIAAPVISGIWGKKALSDLNYMHSDMESIKAKSAAYNADITLMGWNQVALNSINGISRSLEGALYAIQNMQGIWKAMVADINNIVGLIDTDIRKALPIMMLFGAEECIRAWSNAAEAANSFRVNAYGKIDSTYKKSTNN